MPFPQTLVTHDSVVTDGSLQVGATFSEAQAKHFQVIVFFDSLSGADSLDVIIRIKEYGTSTYHYYTKRTYTVGSEKCDVFDFKSAMGIQIDLQQTIGTGKTINIEVHRI